ncbi:MAG: histone deacetylase family protein [Candidatus Dormibacterales bacterium]
MKVFFDPACRDHDPPGHPECPARLDWALRGVGPRGEMETAPAAQLEDLTGLHSAGALARLQGKPGYLDAGETYLGADSLRAALTSAGLARAAAHSALSGEGPALSLGRPPGHHASFDSQMGFCLVNSVAFAARSAISTVERVAIVDFDVHHGNGTQDIFYGDPAVLYVSVHQWPLYPGTGATSERGEGRGEGATVNVPLPPGCGDADYAAVFDEVVLRALAVHSPDLLLVSAGYDAHRRDPLAQMELTGAGFGLISARLLGHGAPTAFILEGGYDPLGLAEGVAATLEAMERG